MIEEINQKTNMEELERKLVLRTPTEMAINGLLHRINEAKELGYLSVVVTLREDLAKLDAEAAENIHNPLQKIMTPWYEKEGRKLRYIILDEMYKSYPTPLKKNELAVNFEKSKNLEVYWSQIKSAVSSYMGSIERHRKEMVHNKSQLEKLTEEELAAMWDGRHKSENY